MQTAAIIVAAGRGLRAGGGMPKQYRNLGDRAVIAHTVNRFLTHPSISQVIVVIAPDDAGLLKQALGPQHTEITVVFGGATRSRSVREGLNAAGPDIGQVLIHDGARPLVSAGQIADVIAALDTHLAAAPALPVTDALWRGQDGRVLSPAPRQGLFRAQTPQGFRLPEILAAHQAGPADAADDVEVALAAGLDVAILDGEEDNIKITHPGDFGRAERILGGGHLDIRTGNGFDVHRFCEGDHVVLAGVTVPHDKALKGHSDADVAMHALTDAIYGALALGDIGRHFPPSDPQWKGADSRIFLEHAAQCVTDRGFRFGNVDITIICERPKVGPHAGAMQAALADIMGIEADRVSVKATTSEQLGFTGRGEGIAAMATATLVKP